MLHLPRQFSLLDASARHPRLLVALLTILAYAVFATYTILRHLALKTLYFDLGIYTNSIWRTVHGYDSWQSLILPSTPGHIGHVSPLLLPVALVYYVLPDPGTLLVIQAAVLALSAIPLYLLALGETRTERLSLLVVALYLANPALHGIASYDFHVEAFLPLFVFMIYYSHRRDRFGLFAVSLALMYLTIEYSAVLGVGIGLSIWLEKKTVDKYLLTTVLVSAVMVVVLLPTVIAWGLHLSSPSSQGSDFIKNGVTALSNPLSLFNLLLYDFGAKLFYLTLTFGPFLLAAVKSPSRIIPGIPWVMIALSTTRLAFYNIDFQYSAFLLPFVYLAAIPFLNKMRFSRSRMALLVGLIMVLMLGFSALSPIRVLPPSNRGWPSPDPSLGVLDTVRASIPANATILVQNDLYPQVADRVSPTINYSGPAPPEFILVRNSPWYEWSDASQGFPQSMGQQTRQLMRSFQYGLLAAQGGVELYKLGFQFAPANFALEKQFDFLQEAQTSQWLASSVNITPSEYSHYNGTLVVSGSDGLTGRYLAEGDSQAIFESTFSTQSLFNDDNWAGIAARVQDPDNYYLFYIRSPSGRVDVVKRIGGRNVLDYTVGTLPSAPKLGTNYSFKVILDGSTARVWVNGLLAGEYGGLTELTKGGTGLLVFRQQTLFNQLSIMSQQEVKNTLGRGSVYVWGLFLSSIIVSAVPAVGLSPGLVRALPRKARNLWWHSH